MREGPKSNNGCLSGSSPALTTKRFITVFFSCRAYTNVRQVFLNKGMVLAKDISYIECIKEKNEQQQQFIKRFRIRYDPIPHIHGIEINRQH
jgi:hypothetical protein